MSSADFAQPPRRSRHRVWGRVWIGLAWLLARAGDGVWLWLALASGDRVEIAYPLLSALFSTTVCAMMWSRVPWSRAVALVLLAGLIALAGTDLIWALFRVLKGFPFFLPQVALVKLLLIAPLYLTAFALLLWVRSVRRLVEGRHDW